MASEHQHQELRVVSLSRKEATDLIGLLVAQMAAVPLVGNMAGATPTVNIVEEGRLKYRLVLTIEK